VLVRTVMLTFMMSGMHSWIGRFFIVDEISFILIMLRVWIYLFCLMSRGSESWSKNRFLSFIFPSELDCSAAFFKVFCF